MADFYINKGLTSPSLPDQLQNEEGFIDLTGCTVYFRMRRVNSSVLKVNAEANIVDAVNGKVEYDWYGTDTDTEGEYFGWWHVVFGAGRVQDSPEFTVTIDDHTEGEGTTTGEISDQARQLMPITWDELSKDARYGDRMLQTRINYVKYKLFATIVDPLEEVTSYNPLLLDFVAKNVALQIIPAGIDYWMNQQESISTSGTREAVSYPNRINALKNLKEWLEVEVSNLRPEFDGQFAVRKKSRAPKVSNGNDLITPNPQKFPRAFDENGRIQPCDDGWRLL